MAPAPFNIVCWRYAPDGLDDEATDQFNREAIAAIQSDGRAAIRTAFDNWSTTPSDVDILQEAVRDIEKRLQAI
jgi:hypothetical protein